MRPLKELDAVRVVRLLPRTRHIDGSESSLKRPVVGDVGTVVAIVDEAVVVVECVAKDGLSFWVADFATQELERVDSLLS